MIPKNRRPSHPGTILKKSFLIPRKIKRKDLAEATGLSAKHISRLVNGRVNMTPNVAARLGGALNVSAGFWITAQKNVDAFDAQQQQKRWNPKRVFRA